MIPKISLEARNMHNELCASSVGSAERSRPEKKGVLFKTGPGHVKDVERSCRFQMING